MSLFYKVAYRLGFTPWEQAAVHPAASQHIETLFDREERERHPPFGRALDLGCGRGHWSVALAQRGWDVTGIDLVPKAIAAARDLARREQMQARFVEGDVTALQAAGVGSGFDLVWDFGTVHGLSPAQRLAVGRQVNAVAADGATILLLAWAPGRRGPLPRGASRSDIEEAFAGWYVTDEEPFDATGLPGALRKVDPRVYRLRRVSAPE